MLKCRYCGAKTEMRVWTKGTKRLFVPICMAARCWKKYWKANDK
jgi:hypothetical protein